MLAPGRAGQTACAGWAGAALNKEFAAMNLLLRSLCACLLLGWTVALAAARADEEKVPIDKLPMKVVDAVKAKFPKAVLKHASKDTVDGKVVYEIGLNIEKQHLHALVTAEGKLFEIHQEIDAKDLPEKVAKAVEAKYPKSKVKGIEQISDADGKVTGYEVTVEAAGGGMVEVTVDLNGNIKKENKVEEPKK
jgi:hypothetical protein